MPSVVFLLLLLGQFGQSNTGELRLTVTDSAGLPLPGAVELVSDARILSSRAPTRPGRFSPFLKMARLGRSHGRCSSGSDRWHRNATCTLAR